MHAGEPTTLVGCLYARARRPDDVALWLESLDHEPLCLRGGDLAACAEDVARGLRRVGVREGDRVLIVLPTSLDFVATFYGVLRCGAVPVPVSPPFGFQQLATFPSTLARYAAVAAPRLTITVEGLVDVLQSSDGDAHVTTPLMTPAHVRAAADPADPLPPEPDSQALGLIQFSSGSTGDPRGICLTHEQLLANIRDFVRAVGASPADLAVSWLPLYHDMGLIGMLLATMVVGCPLVLCPPTDFLRQPAFWFRLLSNYRATISVAPQFAYNLCLARLVPSAFVDVDLASVRTLLNGAEPIDREAVAAFEDRFAPLGLRPGVVTPCYGLGENVLAVSISPRGEGLRTRRASRVGLERGAARPPAGGDEVVELVSAGPPLSGTDVCIRGPGGRLEPDGHIGEIWIRGLSTCRELLTHDGPIPAGDADGWVPTGDLGFLADGELFVIGRVKDLILIGGRNIHAQDLESEAARVDGVRAGRVAAFAIRPTGLGTEAAVVAAETRLRDAARLEACALEIRRRLFARYGVAPYDVVLLDRRHLPLTSSGKLRRFRIRQDYQHEAIDGVLFRLRAKSSEASASVAT